MIPVDHTLVNAYFTDNEKSIVCTEWQSNTEDGAFRTYTFNADENNRWWRALLKHHIDIDSIHENTVAQIRNMRQAFENEVMAIAEVDGINAKAIQNSQNRTIDAIVEWITGDYSDEQVFKIKLRLFEEDRVANSTNRELKAELRKAKTIEQVLQAFLKF